MEAPRYVPDAVIDSIAKSHVKYWRQGECPYHDNTWQGHWIDRAADANPPCACAVRMAKFEAILKDLRWSGDHYSFILGSMYVGVELDGYMHT